MVRLSAGGLPARATLPALLLLLGGATVPAGAASGEPQPRPGFTIVLHEDFEGPLEMFDGRRGIWKDSSRHGRAITNSPVSFYPGRLMRTPAGEPLDLDPVSTVDGRLVIGAGTIPEDKAPLVRAILVEAGYRPAEIDAVRYYTGRITTLATWAQRYGYFEMRARMPRGRGHWPAFWLAPVHQGGWPPEIDIFEIFGRQNGEDAPRRLDNLVHMAVHFDDFDASGEPLGNLVLVNPYPAEDGAAQETLARPGPHGERYALRHEVDVGARLDRDVFDAFNVYAIEWTPETIRWFFGPDRESLVEIFRTPTPEDARVPLGVIINNQIGGAPAWEPLPEEAGRVLAENFEVDYVRLEARRPPELSSGDSVVTGPAEDRTIVGGPADQTFRPGGGSDIVIGGGGRDRFVIDGRTGATIIEDFGAGDVIEFRGTRFVDAADVLARATPVGDDLWLIDAGDPFEPQTVILRNMTPGALAVDQIAVRASRPRAPLGADRL